MPDVAPQCSRSTPPPEAPTQSWEDAPAFREVFLIHFPPLAADAFREAGRHLYDAALEHPVDDPFEPWVRARVRALAADLRISAQVFATLADSRESAGLTIEEHALATLCQTWAAEVVAVALGVEGALEREAAP